MRILESGIGKLAEKIHGGVDQMVIFGLFELVWVWIGGGDALLVTICCCYAVKIQISVTKFDGEMMKEN